MTITFQYQFFSSSKNCGTDRSVCVECLMPLPGSVKIKDQESTASDAFLPLCVGVGA